MIPTEEFIVVSDYTLKKEYILKNREDFDYFLLHPDSPHYDALWSDRIYSMYTPDVVVDEWDVEVIRTHYIYGLYSPEDWNIFYVGQSLDMVSRMSGHRNGISGSPKSNDYISMLGDRGFYPEYTILGEISAPQRYVDKLEFMWIMTVGLSSQAILLNHNHERFIGSIVYNVEDYNLLYQCISERIPFLEYQNRSRQLNHDRIYHSICEEQRLAAKEWAEC